MEKAVKVLPQKAKEEGEDESGNKKKAPKILGGLLEGNKKMMFGTGLLPKEQPEFVSSTVVSTTTIWKKGDPDPESNNNGGQCTSSSGSGGGGSGGSGGTATQQKKKKGQYVLLQQLLMDDDSSANNIVKGMKGDVEGKSSQDSTTSPTVTTTKPHMPASQDGGLGLSVSGDIGEGLEDPDAIMKQLILAFETLEDNDPHKHSAMNELLREIENSGNESLQGNDSQVKPNLHGGSGPPFQTKDGKTNQMPSSGAGMPPQMTGQQQQGMMGGMPVQGGRPNQRNNQSGGPQSQVPKSMNNVMVPPNQTAPQDSGMTAAQSMAAQQMLRGQQQQQQQQQQHQQQQQSQNSQQQAVSDYLPFHWFPGIFVRT